MHFSDCDAVKHDLPPGRGVVDFPLYLQALKDAGCQGAVSVELEYSPEPEKIAEWVRDAYGNGPPDASGWYPELNDNTGAIR